MNKIAALDDELPVRGATAPPDRFARLRTPWPWLVLLLGLMGTAWAWQAVHGHYLHLIESAFNRRAERATAAIRSALAAYEQALRGAAGLFAAADGVTRERWQRYVAQLRTEESLPGMRWIGFAPLVAAEERSAHVQAMRARGAPDYAIWPASDYSYSVPGDLIEPSSPQNLLVRGYDMASDPVRRAALEGARDSGAAQVSGKVRPVPGTADDMRPDFLVFLPLYRGGVTPATVVERRAALLGYVYAPFRLHALLQPLLARDLRDIDLEIYDGPAPTGEGMLFDVNGVTDYFDRRLVGSFAKTETLEINGRPWTLFYSAPSGFGLQIASDEAWIVLGAGIAISLLLFWIATWLFGSRKEAIQLADVMTVSLRQNEARLSGVIHSATEAIIAVDEDQNIVIFNPAAERLFQYSATEAIGTPLSRLIPERYRAAHGAEVERFGATGISERQMGLHRPLFGLRADGTEFPAEATISLIQEGHKKLYTVMLRDVTEQRKAETELRDSEARYRQLVELSPDAIFTNRDNRITLANDAALRLFRAQSKEQVIGKSPFDFIHPAYHDLARERIARLMAGETMLPVVEQRIVGLDGALRDVEVAATSIADADGLAILVVMRDITERKKAEDELKASRSELQRLSAGIQSAREEEKTHIARELHDDLGQRLTALKMDLSLLEAALPQNESVLRKRAQAMHALINSTVASVRRIAANLRPIMLDDLGLVAAIEWMANDFHERYGIDTVLNLEQGKLGFDSTTTTALYRMVQEALTNVARHARATQATITLACTDAECVVSIRDNGQGLSTESGAKPESFGLVGMRERARLLGGHVRIQSVPGQGTTVEIRVPISTAKIIQENA